MKTDILTSVEPEGEQRSARTWMTMAISGKLGTRWAPQDASAPPLFPVGMSHTCCVEPMLAADLNSECCWFAHPVSAKVPVFTLALGTFEITNNDSAHNGIYIASPASPSEPACMPASKREGPSRNFSFGSSLARIDVPASHVDPRPGLRGGGRPD